MTSVQAACPSKDAAHMLLAGMYDSKGQSLATSPFGPARGPGGSPGISSSHGPSFQRLLMVGGSGAASPPASEVSAHTKPSSQMRERMATVQALARQHMALGLAPAQTVMLWGSAVPQPSALLQGANSTEQNDAGLLQSSGPSHPAGPAGLLQQDKPTAAAGGRQAHEAAALAAQQLAAASEQLALALEQQAQQLAVQKEMLQLMSGRQRQSHLSTDGGERTVEATAGGSAAGSPGATAQVAPQPWANPRSLAAAAAEALLDAAEGSGSVTKSTLQQSSAREAGPGSGAQIGHRRSTESQSSSALAEDALQPGEPGRSTGLHPLPAHMGRQVLQALSQAVAAVVQTSGACPVAAPQPPAGSAWEHCTPAPSGKHASAAHAQPQQGGAARLELNSLQALQQQQERDRAAAAHQHAQQQQKKGHWQDPQDLGATAQQHSQQQQWQAAPAAFGAPAVGSLPVTQGRHPLHAGAQQSRAVYPEEDAEGQDWWHCGHASWDAAQYSIAADAVDRRPARMLHYGPQQAGLSHPTQADSEVPRPHLIQGQMQQHQQPSIAELACAERAWLQAAALEGHAEQHVTCRGSAHCRRRRAGKRPPWDNRFVTRVGQAAAGGQQRDSARGSGAGGLSKQHGQDTVPQRILGKMLGRLHRATAASSPHAQPWKRQRCEPEGRCRPSQNPGAYQHQPYGPQAEPPEAQYSNLLQPRDGFGDKKNASCSMQPRASPCAGPQHRSLTIQAHPAGPSAAGDWLAPGQAAAARQLCVSCAPGGSSQAVHSGLQAECLQPPAAPQLAALDLLESRISGLITQVEAQLTLKPVQPVATSQPEVHGRPSRDASSRGPGQLDGKEPAQAADEAAGQVQLSGSHLQQPLCRRGVSLEAMQRILAARHAFVQQQRRQDRAVAGSAGKRFDPASEVERLADEFVNDIVLEQVQELITLCDGLAEEAFENEFAAPVELHQHCLQSI